MLYLGPLGARTVPVSHVGKINFESDVFKITTRKKRTKIRVKPHKNLILL